MTVTLQGYARCSENVLLREIQESSMDPGRAPSRDPGVDPGPCSCSFARSRCRPCGPCRDPSRDPQSTLAPVVLLREIQMSSMDLVEILRAIQMSSMDLVVLLREIQESSMDPGRAPSNGEPGRSPGIWRRPLAPGRLRGQSMTIAPDSAAVSAALHHPLGADCAIMSRPAGRPPAPGVGYTRGYQRASPPPTRRIAPDPPQRARAWPLQSRGSRRP